MPGRSVYWLMLAGVASLCLSNAALSKDNGSSNGDGDDGAASTAALPNIYLDLRTNYAKVPANTLSIGFSNPSLSGALATLRTLAGLTNSPTLQGLPTLSSPAGQNISMDTAPIVPLLSTTKWLILLGGRTRARTWDPLIKS